MPGITFAMKWLRILTGGKVEAVSSKSQVKMAKSTQRQALSGVKSQVNLK